MVSCSDQVKGQTRYNHDNTYSDDSWTSNPIMDDPRKSKYREYPFIVIHFIQVFLFTRLYKRTKSMLFTSIPYSTRMNVIKLTWTKSEWRLRRQEQVGDKVKFLISNPNKVGQPLNTQISMHKKQSSCKHAMTTTVVPLEFVDGSAPRTTSPSRSYYLDNISCMGNE